MQRIYSSLLGKSFPSNYYFLLTLVREVVMYFILLLNTTQTNSESKSLDCLDSQLDISLSLFVSPNFICCLPFFSLSKEDSKGFERSKTLLKHLHNEEFAQVQFKIWQYWPFNLPLILLTSWKEFNQFGAFQFWHLEANFEYSICGQRSSF